MTLTSSIQWCDGTVNPVMGCEGCELWQARTEKKVPRRSCYAGFLHERGRGKKPGHAKVFDEPEQFAGRMEKAAKAPNLTDQKRDDKPWLDGMPRLWFVSDMGDALSKGVSFEYLHAEIIDVANSPMGRRHIWLWLTKQPKRMAEFSKHIGSAKWPANVWPGTSITAKESVDRLHRVDHLRDVGNDSTTRFLSVEPQTEAVSLAGQLADVHWVIQGGESEARRTTEGTPEHAEYGARPFDLAWARQLREECHEAGAAYFLKQLGRHPAVGGKPVSLKDPHGGEWDEWPTDLRVREVPLHRASTASPVVGGGGKRSKTASIR